MPVFPGIASAVSGGAVAQVTPTLAYVFGGVSASGALTNAVVRVTPTGVSTVVTNGTAPAPRKGAAAAYLSACFAGPPTMAGGTGACLVVFGGSSTAVTYLNDVYVLDMRPATPVWLAPATVGAAPSGRYGASAVPTGDNEEVRVGRRVGSGGARVRAVGGLGRRVTYDETNGEWTSSERATCDTTL